MIKNKKGQFFPFADSAPRKSFPVLTILLLILNVSIFVWSLASPEVPYVIEGELC